MEKQQKQYFRDDIEKVRAAARRSKAKLRAAGLSPEQARAIFCDARRAIVVAKEYGLTKEAIYNIRKRKAWAAETADLPNACPATEALP